MHCVARYKCNNDFIFAVRRIIHISQPEVSDHSFFTSQVNTAEAVRSFFAGKALGNYSEILCDVLGSLFDLSGLRHCGLECEPAVAAKLRVDSPEVLAQDADCGSMMRFAIGLVQQRCVCLDPPQKYFPKEHSYELININ